NVASGGDAAGDVIVNVEGVIGSDFADTLTGDGGDNTLAGRGGSDALYGNAGNDTLRGEDGDDHLFGGVGADILDGGTGFDFVRYDSSSAGVIVNLATNTASGGDATGDVIVNFEGIAGSNSADTLTGDGGNNTLAGRGGNDMLYGNAGNDTLRGEDGDDQLTGGAGGDSLDGGAGYDFVRYDSSSAGVTVNLTTNTASGGDAAWDVIANVEGIVGSNYADTLTGDGGNNMLYGQNGNDILSGGAGNDRLEGGAGSDIYVFGRGDGQDRIADHSALAGEVDVLSLKAGIGADQIWLRRVSNDLEVSIIGSDDKIAFEGWYASNENHVQKMQLADGKSLSESNVDALVNAMASFTPPGAAQFPLPAAYATQLNPVIAANWK
ncbi:MAG: cya 9, partial [Hyphomicrobiales bacterium]|nr:cya 9 [Hyphomicrobiales bacterium]